MRTPTDTTTPVLTDGYMNSQEAARYLGISDRMLRALAETRQIEYISLPARGRGVPGGRLRRYTKAALDRFMRDSTIAPGKKR